MYWFPTFKKSDYISICDSFYKREDTIFEESSDEDKKWITYNNWTEWITINQFKTRSSFEKSYALYLVRLERSPVLWASIKQLDDKFGKVLFAIRQIENSNWTKTYGIGKMPYFIRIMRNDYSTKVLELDALSHSLLRHYSFKFLSI